MNKFTHMIAQGCIVSIIVFSSYTFCGVYSLIEGDKLLYSNTGEVTYK